MNDKLSKLIELYNKILSERVIDSGFKLIDVYNLTKGADGFSNRKFHIDLTHLHPKTLEKIKIN